MIDTDKYEGHQPAPWRWVKPMGMEEWFLYAEQGNHSNLNHQGAGGVWLPDTFCRLGKELDPTHRDEKSTYDLIADAPLLLAEVKRLYEMMDVLASFHMVKNVEQGFTQRDWFELVELAKRGEEE
jgi:hypothetical protein